METVKVTKSLAKKVEITAKQMRVSSDKLVSLALEDFLERKRNNDLLKAINEAYKDEPTAEEREEIRLMTKKSFEALDEWK
jgi:predicted transcriptional regulator